MQQAVRAEIQVSRAPRCSLADVVPDASIRSVTRVTDAQGCSVTEFVTDEPVDDAEKVFGFGSGDVYRLEEDGGQPCVCDRVEELGYPVRDHRIEDGVVILAFFVPDIDALRTVVEELAADGRQVSIRRLTRSEQDAGTEPVFVDRQALTDRQIEVLRTAERMGYFEHPRGANAGEIADALDISTSTFTEHLSAAQRKLLCAVLD